MTQKDAYVQKLHAKIDEWNADIDKLKARADGAEADLKADYQNQIQKLKDKRNKIKEQANELQKSGQDAWEDLKSGIDSAWDSLEKAVSAAKSRFKQALRQRHESHKWFVGVIALTFLAMLAVIFLMRQGSVVVDSDFVPAWVIIMISPTMIGAQLEKRHYRRPGSGANQPNSSKSFPSMIFMVKRGE